MSCPFSSAAGGYDNVQGCRECVHPPVVDLLLRAPEAGFLPRLGLGLFMRGAAGRGSNEVLAPAPLSLLHAQWVICLQMHAW